MLFLIAINFYTSKVILKSLGIDDYGIYIAVGGFASMFGMISTALSGAISRYLTISIAKDTTERLREIFSSSLLIQLALCAIVLIVCETIGVWFINTQLIIPTDRIFAANWVFQFSILTFIINLINIPYNSLIIAHEKMSIFAYVGIFEGLGLLFISIIVKYSPIDILISYAMLITLQYIIIRLFYSIYCGRKYPESRFKFVFDKVLIKEMFSFAGWNFIGSAASVLRSQGINLLINMSYAASVIAARGLAMQVNNAISNFVMNFTTAIRPRITKSYAVNDRSTYETLVFQCTKISFLMLIMICLPVLSEINSLVNIWLDEVPEYTISFIQIILILTLVESYSNALTYLLLATAKIKRYQLVVGSTLLFNFPLAYIVLKLGFSPVATVGTSIFISVICLIERLYFLYDMLQFPVVKYLKDVILRTVVVFLLSLITPVAICTLFEESNIRIIPNMLLTEIATIAIIYTVGLNNSERTFITNEIRKIIK